MEIKAEQKFLRMSPRKVRLLVDLIKKLKPLAAIEILPLIGKRAAEPVAKVIKQAVANAKEKGIDGADLIFKEIQVGEGPVLKRGRPVSKGRWHPIKKRMSHIRVVLTTRNTKLQMPNAKLPKKPEVKTGVKPTKVIKKGTKNGTKS